jgi:transketolase
MRAFEFIRTDVGIANLPVKLVGDVPGVLSDGNGPTHQALEDIALMRGVPNMQVVCPADERELAAAMPKVIESRAPTYVRYVATPPAVEHTMDFEIGRAEVLSEAGDVTLLTYGFMLHQAARARAILEGRGVGVRLVNLRTLKPLDERTVLRAARETRLLVTLEDHFVTGGLWSIVAELLLRSGVSCRAMPIAFEERWFTPGRLDEVLAAENLTGERIAERIDAMLRA